MSAAIIVALVLALAAMPASAAQGDACAEQAGAGPGGPVGDVNCDYIVDAIDAALVLQVSAGLISDLLICAQPDANLDGTINAVDAALILQYTAGLVPGLPPPV
jgi:hypothetical protein